MHKHPHDLGLANASGYGSSASNLAGEGLATNGIFVDGYSTQLATMSGSVAAGYTASLTVGIAARVRRPHPGVPWRPWPPCALR